MNYEIKNIKASSVFFYTLRIFPILGFILGAITYWILPNPNVALWLKVAEPFIFTLVYTLVLSTVAPFIVFLYNTWAQNLPGIKIHLEQTEE